MPTTLKREARSLAEELSRVVAAAKNEEQLRHEAEKALELACGRLGIVWTPFRLETALRQGKRSIRFADVIHGAILIEYEAPGSFAGREGKRLSHARRQSEEYTVLLQEEEGRALSEYVLVCWDGSHIDFGRHTEEGFIWEGLRVFDAPAAGRLLGHLRDDGVPLVHPLLLSERVGPASAIGSELLPAFFRALQRSATPGGSSRTKLLFAEWRRLFGQVVGDPTERIKHHLKAIGSSHGEAYSDDPAAYLFALNTYIAVVAKLVAARALPHASQDIGDPTVPIAERVRGLESGRLFADAGITNMLNGDFFSWYAEDRSWSTFSQPLIELIDTLRGINFDVTRKEPASTRDLFKGLYMTFAPPALRHALGEYYTPDWLASHAFDMIDWTPNQSLLDPTCGSGTFLLEALRRRLDSASFAGATAGELLDGLYGFDLNPLAVLATRASLVVFVGHRLDPANPIHVPVYLADAINQAVAVDELYEHSLQTERGVKSFRMPSSLVKAPTYFQVMQNLRELIDDGQGEEEIKDVLLKEGSVGALGSDERKTLWQSIEVLKDLHEDGWDGIWCSILADRFAAAAVPAVDALAGNPPWVRWSHLPLEYAEFIKPLCEEMGVFSTDNWVGGIESDISTVITYKTFERYCSHGGVLAFFITGTVFANESSQGFRRWRLQQLDKEGQPETSEAFQVEKVEDFQALAPFEGVNNHPTLLILRRNGRKTKYPIPYRAWGGAPFNTGLDRSFGDGSDFRKKASVTKLLAAPVPGSDCGPWLKGTRAQHSLWKRLFDGSEVKAFRGRKGVTSDANGIYFVKVQCDGSDDLVKVSNDPANGKRPLPKVTTRIEKKHVFPLLRGKGVSAFRAVADPTSCVIVPQRGMNGDEDLPKSAPKTYNYLKRFRGTLEKRSSYKRFQRKAKYWSLWSTGKYTFAPYKVVWQEMPGGRFAAAYIGSVAHGPLGKKVVVPDHKVYFVPCKSAGEAAYLAGFLNAPAIAEAVNAYAAALSLGVSVVEYLRIPPYDPGNYRHKALAGLSKRLTRRKVAPAPEQWEELDELAKKVYRELDR